MANILVSNRTKVKRLVIGPPVNQIKIDTYAIIDDVIGVDTTGAQDGAILVYSDSSGNWEARNSYLLQDSVVDGKVYPSDSARDKILIRRSGTAGDPLVLRTGELAYSWLEDQGTNGFGNGGDRLYIGTGLEVSVDGVIQAPRIDTIGGRYFTNLLNHQHGIVTASSAIIVDSTGKVNTLKSNNLLVDSATIANYLRVTGDILINGISLSEYIDSDVSKSLVAGTGTTIVYSDDSDKITISTNLASQDSVGVASYGAYADSAETLRQFSVTNGSVSVIRLDGGYLDYEPTLP